MTVRTGGCSVISLHVRLDPNEVRVVIATSVAGAFVLDFVLSAQTAAVDGGANCLRSNESRCVDAPVAFVTNLTHSPHPWDAREHVSVLRRRSGRVWRRAVLHTRNSWCWLSISATADFVQRGEIRLDLVLLIALARVVAAAHDLVVLELTVIHLRVTVTVRNDLLRGLIVVVLEAHAGFFTVVFARFFLIVRRSLSFVEALAPVLARPLVAVTRIALLSRGQGRGIGRFLGRGLGRALRGRLRGWGIGVRFALNRGFCDLFVLTAVPDFVFRENLVGFTLSIKRKLFRRLAQTHITMRIPVPAFVSVGFEAIPRAPVFSSALHAESSGLVVPHLSPTASVPSFVLDLNCERSAFDLAEGVRRRFPLVISIAGIPGRFHCLPVVLDALNLVVRGQFAMHLVRLSVHIIRRSDTEDRSKRYNLHRVL